MTRKEATIVIIREGSEVPDGNGRIQATVVRMTGVAVGSPEGAALVREYGDRAVSTWRPVRSGEGVLVDGEGAIV